MQDFDSIFEIMQHQNSNNGPSKGEPTVSRFIIVADTSIVSQGQLNELNASLMDLMQSDNPSQELPIDRIVEAQETFTGKDGRTVSLTKHSVSFVTPQRSEAVEALRYQLHRPLLLKFLDKLGVIAGIERIKEWLGYSTNDERDNN